MVLLDEVEDDLLNTPVVMDERRASEYFLETHALSPRRRSIGTTKGMMRAVHGERKSAGLLLRSSVRGLAARCWAASLRNPGLRLIYWKPAWAGPCNRGMKVLVLY